MPSAIENFIKTPMSAETLTASFRDLIEDHVAFFLNHSSTIEMPIDAHDANVYMFDWIGLLNKQGIATELHWLTIRMNGGKSFTDFKEDTRSIYIPSTQEYNKLVALNASVKKKK